jgi:hypothetical protein
VKSEIDYLPPTAADLKASVLAMREESGTVVRCECGAARWIGQGCSKRGDAVWSFERLHRACGRDDATDPAGKAVAS